MLSAANGRYQPLMLVTPRNKVLPDAKSRKDSFVRLVPKTTLEESWSPLSPSFTMAYQPEWPMPFRNPVSPMKDLPILNPTPIHRATVYSYLAPLAATWRTDTPKLAYDMGASFKRLLNQDKEAF